MEPDICGLSVGPNICGPSVEPNIFGPSVEPNIFGPSVEPNICGPSVEPNICGPSVEPDICGLSVEPNICEPSVEPNICWPSASISLYVILLAPRVLKLPHLFKKKSTPTINRPTYYRGYREHREASCLLASSHNGWRTSLLTFTTGCTRTTGYINFV